MNTALLTAGVIPRVQPYSAAPWHYTGTDSVNVVPAGVVDWVLIELRTDTAPTTKIATRAAFIKSNGTVVDIDGTSAVAFASVVPDDYYVVVRHRNHLAVMTSSALALGGDSTLYDLTTAQSSAYSGGADGLKAVGTKFAMFAGNGNGDGSITAKDHNLIWLVQNGFLNGYYDGDFNFDTNVTAKDRNGFWLVNNGTLSQVP